MEMVVYLIFQVDLRRPAMERAELEEMGFLL